jgi:hypothetical protein
MLLAPDRGIKFLKAPCARDQDADRSPALGQRVTIKKKLNDEEILKICKSKIYAPPILELRKTEFFLR